MRPQTSSMCLSLYALIMKRKVDRFTIFFKPVTRMAHIQVDFFKMKVTLVILFRQTEIVLKDSTAFVYVTKSEKSSH